MKEKNYILSLLLFHCFIYIYKSIVCPTNYVALPHGTQGYCAKCDTTCKTCTNEGMNNCILCPDDFTFDQKSSYCIPPSTKQINTIQSSYKFIGFSQVTGWSGGSPYTDSNYAPTVYKSSGSEIIKTFTITPAHYQLRLLVSLWFLTGSSSTDYVNVKYYDNTNTLFRTDTYTNFPTAGQVTGSGFQIYPTGWRSQNIDQTFSDSYHDVVKIGFSSNLGADFGIRQFIFIQYLCNQTACSRCDGLSNSSCLQCAASSTRIITAAYPKQCLCNTASGVSYFKHPDWDYCVNPCPNRLDGQYYGDPITKNCVLTCTHTTHYADPVTGICDPTCSAAITLGSISRPLYYDTRNKKCVTICPSTQPYFNTADRICYSTCPGAKYKNDVNMECVTDCPDTGAVPLFGENGKCVEQCVGADNWADFNTHKCTATCLNAGGFKYFQDNSTRRNLCVRVCPFPEYFGDYITNSSQPYCDQICPDTYYGDYLSPRWCVNVCTQDTANSINYYGLKVDSRQCVKVCPQGSWGQKTNYTCVQTAAQCQGDANKYADNTTWTCVAKGSCSKGRYTLDSPRGCVINCPSGTYADDSTHHCEAGCSGSYFADPGINKCVTVCQTQDLYADTTSSNKCVAQCNQTSTKPFRDPTTKTCVNICPISIQLFADTTAKSCVYNCTPGTYAYNNVPTDNNKTCVSICPGLFFADNSTGYGVCVLRCPQNPILFGDVVGADRICTTVCQTSKYGDQDAANGRLCNSGCPTGWFAQNDNLRRCVKRCNSTTYGYNLVCVLPANCPANWVGDPSTSLCVSLCPASQGTFSDLASTRLCVEQCPIIGTTKYFADPTLRWCVDTCNASHNLFGNNKTLTCQTKCIDLGSYADAQHAKRYCNEWCTNVGQTLYYRNNFTKTCVVSGGCPTNYFGDNDTKACVAKCPIINTNQQTWGHQSTQTCVTICYGSLWGDTSSGIPLCIPKCLSVPVPKWSYNGDMTCVTQCPGPNLWGQDFGRTCVSSCPNISLPTIPYQTFAYDVTRRCLQNCPKGTFADYTTGKCYPTPGQCTFGWGDPFNNSCTHKCTGPTPWDSFGDSTTDLCTIFCSQQLYADDYTGTRQCVGTCPGTYDVFGNVTGSYDTFGDNDTNRCQTFCKKPGWFADWQVHRCQPRCSGDNAALHKPTYSNNVNKRCVIALACPATPDKLFGDNRTRSCLTTCFNDATTIQWADNLTRTCIPQCYHINDTGVYPYDTRFYGDISTGSPYCLIICPTSPRMFGVNSTNKCILECPSPYYGDQVNNRSCVADCYEWQGVIYYSQDTARICVAYCEDSTYANWHNRHCQADPRNCVANEYANDGNNSCVALCPEYMNYFGDPSTKKCVKTCPNITAPNSTPVPQAVGYYYADYSTRLCVRTCPATHGLHGTFGDNITGTCVQRCPDGSFGDPLTTNRRCVAVCTNSNFADPLSQLCVSKCPASPPYFGYRGDWTCVQSCPTTTLWADSLTRQCVATCPTSTFRLTSFRKQCVDVCPSNPDLYADSDSGNCQTTCTLSKFADPTDRRCKSSCLPLFQYNFRCVKFCPKGYYANALGNCVVPASCGATVPFAQNVTTKCVATCTGGSFADPNSHYCIAVCPDGWFGDGNVCTQTCLTTSTSASNITQTCVSTCPNLTYHQNGACLNKCIVGYANDQLGKCHTSCPTSPKLYANPTNHDCDSTCSTGYVRDPNTGFCVVLINGCYSGWFSDVITGDCVTRCSLGYWGNKHTFTCDLTCPTGQYGYSSVDERTCYLPSGLPGTAPVLYADPQSRQFIPVCPITPKLYFADTILKLCSETCATHATTDYYGDPESRKCQSSCTNGSFYTADPQQNKCVLKCTLGTFRFNNSNSPICRSTCPSGYADSAIRVCVLKCPLNADTYGFVNTTSGQRLCVNPCPNGYFAQPTSRECMTSCSSVSLFADNTTHRCVEYCVDSFADKNGWRCMDKCYSNAYPSADNSTNECVLQCPSTPDYYNQNHICVYYCTTTGYFADPSTRQCVSRCPNVTATPNYNSYGDQLTGRCIKKCPEQYWGDNSTNKCVKTCPPNSYADNDTRMCVSNCPVNQSIYADPYLHMCAYTCSNGWFGSQVNQQCVATCDNGATQATKYWGDPLTTLCVNVCPSSIYSYGENVTRKCVASCSPHQTYGFADNFSRICRDKCQNTLPIAQQTFADPTTSTCVQICPDGYFAENTTNQCLQVCLTGYADNYSRYCVTKCPDDPQSYGDTNANGDKICVYQCMGGRFSNNDTNLCDTKCPTSPDFFGDPNNGRCVHFCTEGTYAQNGTRQCLPGCPSLSYADNLTRRCVQFCPNVTQATYRDTTTQKCVRVCPNSWWAQNSSAICVNDCPKHPNGTQTYQDQISKYCVAVCPFPYYGKNDTHQCVLQCSALRSLYGHDEQRVCVVRLDCYPVGVKKYYADDVSGTCVQKCPLTLWADDVTWTCVANCDPVNVVNKVQFRNYNNQKCVPLCPSDPAEYGDDVSGNCVRKCPDGYYSHSYTGFRKCVQSCQPYSLYADNTTNRCVAVCPTKPFMYANINIHKCVYQCADNLWFADNKTQTCVETCPAEWELFGQRITYTCVQLCPDTYYADIHASAKRQCNQQCTSPNFADKWTSMCVAHCSQIRQYYYEDTSTNTGICVETCPTQSYGYNPDQTCKYRNVNLSSSCPGQYYADPTSKQCVKTCPNGTFADVNTKYCQSKCSGIYFADNSTRKCQTQCSLNYFALVVDATKHVCVQFCPAPYYAQNSSHSCVPFCAALYELQTTRSCQSYCPQPYFKYNGAAQGDVECRTNCTPLYADITSRQCISVCNSPDWSNPFTKTCDLICPDGYYGRPNGRICSLTCQQGTFADPSTRLCLPSCPQFPLLFADDLINECVQKCPSSPTRYFGYEIDRTCRPTCPTITVNSKSIVYLADSSNNLCVLQCINEVISFADYDNNVCTSRCPDGTFANNFTKQCVPTCPTTPNDTFAQNTSHICMEQCPPGQYGSSQNLYCNADCWWPNFEDQTTRLCVEDCPAPYFTQNQTAMCVKNCKPNTYADPTTGRCVIDCPLMHDLFKYDELWTCVKQCPPSFYADDTQRKCKQLCAQDGMYAYQVTRQCLRQCPVPYRAYDINHTCILNCPALYFYNITRNKCTKCPQECLVCTSPTSCLTCASGFNLFSGMCDVSCQPLNGIITFSDPQGVCVKICPFSYFGNNNTYACVKTCPVKQYGSTQTQLCQNCPQTCSGCQSSTKCTACEKSSTLAIDNMCYQDCNLTHKYYWNNSCFQTCPGGTYVTYTNVYCGACAASCATCNVSATKCLSCQGRFFYNYTCITKCPDGFFGNASFSCQSCNDSGVSCSKPLTFTTQIAVQNFKYVVYLKFNQNISIEKQIKDIIKVKLKVSRRLLDATDMINNGIKYDYQILADGRIKLTLYLDATLYSPQFTIQITDPTAIKTADGSGATLQISQQSFVIDKVQFFAPSQGRDSPTNFGAKFAVILMLLLYAFSFFWTDAVIKPLQFLQLALLHATINSALPPSFFFYLFELKKSLMDFLPNYFASFIANPAKTYHLSSQKIIDTFIDYNFLRNLGQMFFFISIFATLWVIFFFLSNKRIICNKVWFSMFDDVFKRRFKYMAINDVFGLFYVPILWFAFTQFKDLQGTGLSSSYSAINAAVSVGFMIIAILMPIVYFLFWFKFQPLKFQQQCSFMCKRLKKIQISYQIYSQGQQAHSTQKMAYHHNKTHEKFTEEFSQKQKYSTKHYQNQNQNQKQRFSQQKLSQQPPALLPASNPNSVFKNSKHQLQPVFTKIYLFLMTIWMTVLYDEIIIQLILLLVTNAIYAFYLVYFRPNINILNTIFTPLMVSSLAVIQSFMIYFNMKDKILTVDDKFNVSKIAIIILTIIFMLMIIWTIWRVIYDGMDIWNYFKKTQFYLIYGDSEHAVEEEVSETYQKFSKKAQNLLKYKEGDQFIQKITKQVNQHGESIIKVKKKVLRKKKNIQGRKRQIKRQQIYREGQSSSEQQSLAGEHKNDEISSNGLNIPEQEQFIRVNKPTPFQMTKLIDAQIDQKKEEIIKQSKMNFKSIDDDIRDSEDQDDEYSIPSPKKSHKVRKQEKSQQEEYYQRKNNINKIDSNRNKKAIVQIQQQDSSVHGIDDILQQQNKRQHFKKQTQQEDQPFEFISDVNEQQHLQADENKLNVLQLQQNPIKQKQSTIKQQQNNFFKQRQQPEQEYEQDYDRLSSQYNQDKQSQRQVIQLQQSQKPIELEEISSINQGGYKQQQLLDNNLDNNKSKQKQSSAHDSPRHEFNQFNQFGQVLINFEEQPKNRVEKKEIKVKENNLIDQVVDIELDVQKMKKSQDQQLGKQTKMKQPQAIIMARPKLLDLFQDQDDSQQQKKQEQKHKLKHTQEQNQVKQSNFDFNIPQDNNPNEQQLIQIDDNSNNNSKEDKYKYNKNILKDTDNKNSKDIKIFDLQELVQQEEQRKNNKLMFLFDDVDQDQDNNQLQHQPQQQNNNNN